MLYNFSMPTGRFKTFALALAAGVCLFHLLTLRAGQGWMDDYAQYVLHARNLAEGRSYADTGYILNPSYQTAGPVTYPPVFPLLLAPVYKYAGMNLQAMKALTVLFFAAFLYVMCLLFRGPLGERGAPTCAALVGLSPVFWKFKDYLYAEYPFLFFSFAALYAWRLARSAEDGGGRWLPRALAAGALAYLAYGTRSAGAALFPAFFIADLAGKKRISRTTPACCAAALVPAAAQWLTLHGDAVYALQARDLLSRGSLAGAALNNLLSYAESFTLLFDNGYFSVLPAVLLAAFAAAAAAGLVRRGGREPLFAAYIVVNAALLLLFPASDGLRYAFPLVPFLFYYAFEGWAEYGAQFGRAARYAPAALLLAAALSYAGAYSKARYGAFREGTEKAETGELFGFIRREVPADALIISRKPRTLALLTGRPGAMYSFGPDAENLEFFRKTGARWLVAGAVFPEDEAFLKPFIARHKKLFAAVYSNPDFTVYQLGGQTPMSRLQTSVPDFGT